MSIKAVDNSHEPLQNLKVLIKRYTEDHEWISVDTDTRIGTIGITEYAQNALGDVVYVELPSVGDEVTEGDSIGSVESVKSASDIMCPVSGVIHETNLALDETPKLVNQSAEGGDGWIAKIEVTEVGMEQLEGLMDEEAYKVHTSH
ncbi:hypothetical protein ABW19_dt0203771 [Dactylella cylindrospora]|nr:hypothetical protein ABW19_dt0203771 [Dactylella cylindrospora]